jgi:glutamyl-tRNA synthetase
VIDSTLPPVRVRFAPSPTGRTHLGSGRTALYNYLLAKQTGGTFILRIEDTDQKRYVPGAENELMDNLHWLGLTWDEGPDVGGPHAPYYQKPRKNTYQQYAQQLVEMGKAYPCFCTPERLAKVREGQIKQKLPAKYDGRCRDLSPVEAAARVDAGEKHVIRFKMPQEGTITVTDKLRGEITFENKVLDDYIIVKSDGLALYHLAAMVDDHLMEITHVIRGSEWLSTFPLHAHIIRAFGWQEPVWIHLSVFLKPTGKGKMSKREDAQVMKDGYSIFVGDLEKLGYIPEAINNWIVLMGWSFDDHTEIFSMDDLIKSFSLERLNPSPAAINFSKLDHFNGMHIRMLEDRDLASRVRPFLAAAGCIVDDEKLLKIIPLIRERLVTLDDAVSFAGFFFEDEIEPDPQDLVGKDLTVKQSANALKRSLTLLENLPAIDVEHAEEPFRALAEELELKPGQLFGMLRISVTGQPVSPPLFESMAVIGREKVLERVKMAIHMLEQM